MKRIICLIISLCLILGSFSFAFAEAWTSTEAQQVTSDVLAIKTYLQTFLTTYNVNGGNVRFTFNDLASDVHQILHFVSPSFSSDTGLTLWDYLFLIGSEVNSLWSQWTSNLAQLNTLPSIASTQSTYFEYFRKALTNRYSGRTDWDWAMKTENAHVDLIPGTNGQYPMFYASNGGLQSTQQGRWMVGTPLGNIAWILREIMKNDTNMYGFRWAADLTGYNAQLSVWDSQGNTLQQTLFTPLSAINGLYNYLAYTQRDVARLTYVLASDEEIEAREEARANQTEVFDNFIDPNGSGSASVNDFADVSSASGNVKQNFSTGYSASSIWDIFNRDHYGWFSQECADALDTTNSSSNMRKSNNSDYPTPLLDAYYEEILSLGGLKDD